LLKYLKDKFMKKAKKRIKQVLWGIISAIVIFSMVAWTIMFGF